MVPFFVCADVPHRAGTWHNQWAAHDLGQWTGKFLALQGEVKWVAPELLKYLHCERGLNYGRVHVLF